MRYASEADVTNALNRQRHADTAVRYTTAAPNPMQIKIELLAALRKGKPVLVFAMSQDKKISALGRNVIAAVDMLEPHLKAKVRTVTHGW